MFIEGSTFERSERKGDGLSSQMGWPQSRFSQIESSEAGIDLGVEGLRVASLRIIQACELPSIAKDKFNLETGAVEAIDVGCTKFKVSGEQEDVALLPRPGFEQIDEVNVALESDRPNDGAIKLSAIIQGLP